MNIQTEKLLQEAVQKGLSIAEKTGEFAIEQAPDLLNEFYMWHITSNILEMIMWLSILFIVYQCRKLISKKEETTYYDFKWGKRYFETDEAPFIIYFVISSFILLLTIICVYVCTYDLIKLIVAPKIYLIEYFIN